MSGLVKRSSVPQLVRYDGYLQFLREDFHFSCAYCSIAEIEAAGIGFQIDHFFPIDQGGGENDYLNLVYSCQKCNRFKSNTWPDSANLSKGERFLDPDNDNPLDHYELVGKRLEFKTPVGQFTIAHLRLNRDPLLRLREKRRALLDRNESIIGGLHFLAQVRLDNIPQEQRGSFEAIRRRLGMTADQLWQAADFAKHNKSDLLDPPDNPRVMRAEYLRRIRELGF